MKRLVYLSVFTFFILFGCVNDSEDRSVMYRVICNKPGITVEFTPGTKVKLFEDVNDDLWMYEYKAQSGETVSILAKSKNINSKITVEIYYNGGLFAKAVEEGDYPEIYINERLY